MEKRKVCTRRWNDRIHFKFLLVSLHFIYLHMYVCIHACMCTHTNLLQRSTPPGKDLQIQLDDNLAKFMKTASRGTQTLSQRGSQGRVFKGKNHKETLSVCISGLQKPKSVVSHIITSRWSQIYISGWLSKNQSCKELIF